MFCTQLSAIYLFINVTRLICLLLGNLTGVKKFGGQSDKQKATVVKIVYFVSVFQFNLFHDYVKRIASFMFLNAFYMLMTY